MIVNDAPTMETRSRSVSSTRVSEALNASSITRGSGYRSARATCTDPSRYTVAVGEVVRHRNTGRAVGAARDAVCGTGAATFGAPHANTKNSVVTIAASVRARIETRRSAF